MSSLHDHDPLSLKEKLLFYRNSFGIKGNDPRGHNRLGMILVNQGKPAEAIAAFQRALALQPGYADACHNLGNAYTTLNQPDKALAAFREAKRHDPANATARHMVKALSGEQPASPSRKFVRRLFDQYADTFDRHLYRSLDYRAPAKLRQALESRLPAGRRFRNTIDLGCGTGLAGLALADLTDRLSGIDLSGNMLAEAGEKQVYDRLEKGDICSVLARRQEKFDLFLAADVLVYVGCLERLFRAVREKALPSARFALTTERHRGHGFRLRKSGRYAHSRRYLATVSRRYGFVVEQCRETRLRRDHGHWLKGDVYILGRSGPPESHGR